jgi:hypothetical protein
LVVAVLEEEEEEEEDPLPPTVGLSLQQSPHHAPLAFALWSTTRRWRKWWRRCWMTRRRRSLRPGVVVVAVHPVG